MKKQLLYVRLSRIIPLAILCFCLTALISCQRNKYQDLYDQLKINYIGDASIEVGGPYNGVAFHHSSCMPQRISFYYPVANSIDISTDFWHRDTTHILAAAITFGEEQKEWLGDKAWEINLTPYQVEFVKSDTVKSVNIIYQFLKSKPAMVISYTIRNRTNKECNVSFETHLETSLRTCHTFKKVNEAWTAYDPLSQTVYTNFPDPETENVQLFVANAGEVPHAFQTSGPLKKYLKYDLTTWETEPALIPQRAPAPTSTRFLYQKRLTGGESFKIVQIIGSARQNEGRNIVASLQQNYQQEIKKYEQEVLKNAVAEKWIETGNPAFDQSTRWALAILQANIHYLDGEFVPMPCPAEYNFYFSHDVLVSDLAAVSFDTLRVKRDLDYIMRHADQNKIIPHAYYWKDSTFVTEYANFDNWNNFWIIITSASYLRHSADSTLIKRLYPYLNRSLQSALKTRESDGLMWTYQPDWWDIGSNYAPRSYMTILAIKALRDYVYIATALGSDPSELAGYAGMADSMQTALNHKLWFNTYGYLMNYYADRHIDPHYYMGSLLAVHYNLIDAGKRRTLLNSARKKLLDPKIGIYNVYPMDFEDLIDYLKFVGNEAGDKYYYMNGGVWPQANTWFALALMADSSYDEAREFMLQTMTLNGIISGPNGQPAMYEVRNANHASREEYGKVDKPQFMWAAAWYLNALYNLLGFKEDSWNLYFQPGSSEPLHPSVYQAFMYGKKTNVMLKGNGPVFEKILYNDRLYPSALIPVQLPSGSMVELQAGLQPAHSYLKSSNSTLLNAEYSPEKNLLEINLKAFRGHLNITKIITPQEIKSVMVDGRPIPDSWQEINCEGYKEVVIKSVHQGSLKNIQITFM